MTAGEENAKFSIRLNPPPPVGPGKMMMRLRIKSDHPGKIHLRWEEKGVKPVYFRDRLVRTDGYPKDQWQTIDIPFTAKNPVASFRVDFMQPPGTILIEKVELLRNKTALRTWKFSASDKE